jgi:hypothetical protein
MKNLGPCVLTALALAEVGQSTAAEAPTDPSRPLAAAVSAFNAQSGQDPIGRLQAPLTEEELVAAICSEESHRRSRDQDEELAALAKVAQTRQLPDGWKISVDSALLPHHRFAFEVWSVTLDVQKGQELVHRFPARQRMVRARLLGVEERAIIEKWRQQSARSPRWKDSDEERLAAAQKDCAYLNDVTVASGGSETPRSTAARVLAAHDFIGPQAIVDADGVTWVVAHKPRWPSEVTIAIVEMKPGNVVSVSVAGYAHVGSAWAVLGRLFMEPVQRTAVEIEQQIKAKLHAL